MRHVVSRVLVITATVALLSLTQHKAKAHGDDDGWEASEQHRIREGFRIAPVHLDLRHKDPDLVGLGSYLVNAIGGCNDCHTNPSYVPGGDPFMGNRRS